MADKHSKSMHRFIINTERINEYGYRVLTDGIQTEQYEKNPVVLYIHNRGMEQANGSEVIGRVVKLEKKEGVLYADIEFDKDDEFAAKIAGKVERGYIRMASMYADVLETSIKPEDVLPGQKFETVTKSKLVEISIVDIGGNDDAIKLSRNSGRTLKLQKLSKENTDMSEIKTIALSLGMKDTASTSDVVSELNKIKLAKDQAETRVTELVAQINASHQAEASSLVDEAVQLSLIPEGLKDTVLAGFENDFDAQKVKLTKLISDKQSELVKQGKHQAVTNIVLSGQANNGNPVGGVEESFDFLQKKDPIKLAKIRDEQPKLYEKLATDYANGVRHVEK